MHEFVKLVTLVIAMAANASGRSLLGNRAGPELARTVKFPALMKAEHGYGFHSVDPDGIYRAYHADGRVLDAARLDRTQIDAYLAALEGAVAAGAYTQEQLAKDRINFATVDSTTVPEENLLHPSEDIKPAAKLKFAFQYYQEQEKKAASTDGLNRRQYEFCWVHPYCTSPTQCPYPCYCNGIICE